MRVRVWLQRSLAIMDFGHRGLRSGIRVYTSETESTCLHEMALSQTFALRQMQLQQFDQYTKCCYVVTAPVHRVTTERVSDVLRPARDTK